MSERWEEILDTQLGLYDWWRTALAARWAKGWGEAVLSTRGKLDNAMLSNLYSDLPRRCGHAIISADPIYVEPDMMTLIEAASKSFAPEPLLASDPPCAAGFIWLPRPFYAIDRHGKRVSWRGINWYPAESLYVDSRTGTATTMPGVFIAFYNLITDPDDYPWPNSELLPPQRVILDHIAAFAWGDRPGTLREIAPAAEPPPPPQYTDVMALVQCIWRLMAQKIAVPERLQATAPFRRRWEKARKESPRPVTVIRLRRPSTKLPPGHEPREIEWTHRWWVRGHWREVYFGSLGPARNADGSRNDRSHRQMWIAGFVKGPEDKPLQIPKLRAFEWVR